MACTTAMKQRRRRRFTPGLPFESGEHCRLQKSVTVPHADTSGVWSPFIHSLCNTHENHNIAYFFTALLLWEIQSMLTDAKSE